MRFAAAAALVLLALPASAAPAKLMPGALAPQFVRPDLKGTPVDLHALRGKIVLIDFWASWCPPCILEIPHLIDLQKRTRGLAVVGISMDDTPAAAREVAARFPFNYPLVMGDAKFGTLYGGVLGLPVQFLVGRDGTVLKAWRGEVSPAELEKAIQTALNARGAKP